MKVLLKRNDLENNAEVQKIHNSDEKMKLFHLLPYFVCCLGLFPSLSIPRRCCCTSTFVALLAR